MKLLLDMNLPPLMAEQLTEAGVEAVHWFFIGAPDAKDEEILSFARENNYIVMTCDLDYGTILAITQGLRPSIIQLRLRGIKIDRDVPIIATVVRQCENELEQGAILTIDAQRRRLRLLPLPQ